ncbi:DnaJ domain [Leishmania braziliensis]|nr:DnaJ domain [Leishmania braziliensis]
MDDEDAIRAANLLRGDDRVDNSGVDGARILAIDPLGYYARLGVSPKATQQEIRRAFLFLSQRYHTDKHASQGDTVQSLMSERFQELQDAYTVLSDERQRAAYDAGGDTGIQRLALVPAGLHRREDILNYILSLDRETQLLRTAKLLSATSQTTVNFSTAHLFSLRGSSEGVGSSRGSSEGGDNAEPSAHGGSSSSNNDKPPSEQLLSSPSSLHAQRPVAQPTTASATTSLPAGEAASTAPATPAPAAAPPQSVTPSANSTASSEDGKGEPPAPTDAMQAQLTAKEIVIDGQRHIVLIPSQEVQWQLRQRMLGLAAGEAAASSSFSGGGDVPRAVRPRRLLSASRAIMFTVVPKSMKFRSSFQHFITPRLSITFRTDGAARMQKTITSLTTTAEYRLDDVRTYETSLRMTVHGLKWCVTQTRALNPLWTLKAKLTALTSSALLQKLELVLTRRMSATAELENVLAMSITENGYFRSSFNSFADDVQQGLSTYLAFHNMHVTAFTGRKVVLGVDTRDPKHPPAYGLMQYSVNCSPLAGQSTFGIEAWYFSSKTQRYGLAFTAVVPYAVSPIAPPFFFVRSAQFAVVNQISILYARGSHRISVPIIVFISLKVSHGLMWLSVPLALYRIGSMLYRPYARGKAIRYYTQQRKLHIAEVDVARERARMEQLALESLVLMSRAREERKGGLVIINARYGVIEPQFAEITPPVVTHSSSRWWPSQIMARVAKRIIQGWMRHRKTTAASSGAGDDTFEARHDPIRSDAIPLSIDVTIAVQNLVRDSALTLPAGTKSSLVGFCNPDPYTPECQKLKIVYWFRKRKHIAVFNDDEGVDLPQREHLIKS